MSTFGITYLNLNNSESFMNFRCLVKVSYQQSWKLFVGKWSLLLVSSINVGLSFLFLLYYGVSGSIKLKHVIRISLVLIDVRGVCWASWSAARQWRTMVHRKGEIATKKANVFSFLMSFLLLVGYPLYRPYSRHHSKNHSNCLYIW